MKSRRYFSTSIYLILFLVISQPALSQVSSGDIAPLGNPDGQVNVGDALVALRFALGLEPGHPTSDELSYGDVAPLDTNNQPNPDGQITVGDALVILRKALGIISWTLDGVENSAPSAQIASPVGGAISDQGESISFNGSGNDTEDGTLSGNSLLWTSSLDGEIGTGASFTNNGLSLGQHTITLTVTDSQGATGTASVTITVKTSGVSTICQDVGGYWDILFGVISCTEGLIEAFSVLSLEDSQEGGPQITITPPLESIDLFDLPDTITVEIDYGTGVTTEDGTVISGTATISLSNIIFGEAGISAGLSIVFSNIAIDGISYLSGSITGSFTMAGDTVSGSIQFNNVQLGGSPVSGSVDISATDVELDLENPPGTITLTFKNFVACGYEISSGTIEITPTGEDQYQLDVDLNITQIIFDLILNMTISNDTIVLDSTGSGTTGNYSVEVDGVTFDTDVCEDYPIGGTATYSQADKTAIVQFNSDCNVPYTCSETN